MPNFLIREMRVLRLMPMRAAAPVAPPTRPLLSVSARTISSRCFLALSSATLLFCFRASTAFFRNRARLSGSCSAAPCVAWCVFDLCSSSSGASNDMPRVRITARSTKFSSSLMFPGQSQAVSPFIIAAGIAAIFSVRDHLFEIAIRRSNQPDVDFSRHGAAQALEFTLLENPQELGLDLNWDVSHLIQEQSAFVGKFETADFLCNRSGKGSSVVAKEFAFQQIKRDSGAVQFDVRTSTTRADVVNRMRDELLACACLTLNQYSRRRGPHASYLLQHGFQRRTVANNLLERAVLILQPAQAWSFEASHNYLLET